MQAPPLDDIALFVEVVRLETFSKASARLGIPNATLSRRIAAMEDSLGCVCLNEAPVESVPQKPPSDTLNAARRLSMKRALPMKHFGSAPTSH